MAVTAAKSAGFDATWNDAHIVPSCADSSRSPATKDESLILFQPQLLSRIPRAWEREATNAFTARLKGHKVWKRYNLRSEHPKNTGPAPASEVTGPEAAREESGRAVKRLRVGPELVPRFEQPGTDGGSYVGTVWGSGARNMKRKIASQQSTGHNELPSRGCDISPGSVNVLSDILDVSMSEVQDSSSITGPCAEVKLGSRLSDDTNMLKDFLDRVKAKKAATSVDMSEAHRPVPPSPLRSPRKVLADVDNNLPSPRRSQEIANRPGTPPGKHMLESSNIDDLDDAAIEPIPFRRSERVRLPGPQRLTRGTPSLIPVRRPNGPEAVVLQKSVAQEIALTTRANTRRNKGRSKPAVLALQTLAKEPVQLDAPVREVKEGAKQVAWDEKLVYHLEGEARREERKPKMRRLKGLGTANGTPAAKKERASALPYPVGGLGSRGKGRTKA